MTDEQKYHKWRDEQSTAYNEHNTFQFTCCECRQCTFGYEGQVACNPNLHCGCELCGRIVQHNISECILNAEVIGE